MSYILDALRRAEIERERGQVPGLHAHATPPGLGEGEAAGRRWSGRLLGAAVGAVVLLGAIVAWWSSRGDGAPSTGVAAGAGVTGGAAGPASRVAEGPGMAPGATASTGQPAGASDTASAVAASPSSLPATVSAAAPPLLVAPPAPPVPVAAPVPLPTSTSSVRAAAPSVASGARTPPVPATTAPAAATVPATPAATESRAAPAAANTGVATGAPAASGKPTLLADLPPAQRAELPQMQIGGAIYSDQPASRFVVINGLVVREGETAAPGVVLERIGPKSALIRWREMRIELPI